MSSEPVVGCSYSNDRSCIGRRFPPLRRNFGRKSRGKKQGNKQHLNHAHFFGKLTMMLDTNIKDSANFIRVSLTALKNSELKKLSTLLNDVTLEKGHSFPYRQWFGLAQDLIDCRLLKPKPTKPKKVPPSNICPIYFDNKAIEMINIPKIFRNPLLKENLPPPAKNFEVPTIVYSLNKTISSKIFNFNSFTTSLDVQTFINDPATLPCNCENSPFKDDYHGHIISGDLRIIHNNKLRKLMTKGPKFRESKELNFDVARTKILEGIESCVNTYCEKNRLDRVLFNGWKQQVISLLDTRIESLKSSVSVNKVAKVLSDTNCKNALSELHENFVVAPIDKATGNVAIICKRFYAKVLVDELGLKENRSSTYKKINSSAETVIERNVKDLRKKFGIEVSEENRCLPHIYWLPKMHKTPLKFRFIIAAPKCSIKPLSKAITSVFRLFYNLIENFNSKDLYYSSVKSFWVIQNNQKVLESLTRLNKRKKGSCISTYDFSTLYTKIPHDKLLDVLFEITDFCFAGGTNSLISVTNSGARWVKNASKSGITFSQDSFKEALRYLMESCFFSFGDMIFRQAIGIPMGSDPAPFMANLFLYSYERKYVQNLRKKDLSKARLFRNTFRFIDDLLTVNDDGEFEKCHGNIYPAELELKKEHSGNLVSFLDLKIELKDRSFETSLFDKRDDFPFSIVRMPYRESNMPSRIFYSSIGAEVLRIARTSMKIECFQVSSKALIDRMVKQGASVERLLKTLRRMYERHDVLKKFSESCAEFLSLFR